MTTPAPTPGIPGLELGLAFPSSAAQETGFDNPTDTGFRFGSPVVIGTGRARLDGRPDDWDEPGASSDGGLNFGPLIAQVAAGVVVAVLAKWAWSAVS